MLAFHLVLSTAILTGCSNIEGRHNEKTGQQTDIVAEKTDNDVEKGITFQDGNGNVVALNDLKGKVVFINFWATWCPPCIAELPSIDKLYQQFKDNDAIVFAMVDVDGQYEKSKQFMQNKNLDLPVHKAIGKIPADWLGNAIPTTLIIDKQGRIAAKHEGMADYSRPEVVAFINELIAME